MNEAEMDMINNKNLAPPLHPILAKMYERGIPVWHTKFNSSVNNADDVPEDFFSLLSNSKSRHVNMWWVNGDGLLCHQKGKWWVVPSAMCNSSRFVYSTKTVDTSTKIVE